MSSALQNRLVGTVILVAIAVIFLPDLLDGKKESKQDLFVELPTKPSIKKVLAPESFDTQKVQLSASRQIEIINESAVDEPEVSSSPVEIQQQVSPKEAENTGLSDESSSLAKETVVDNEQPKSLASAGWVVQLGSFRHQKNVRELLTKLEQSGYRAFSRPVQTSSGLLTKVFVGPELQKDKLEKVLPHLKEITALQGRVTPFTVQ
ncbi:SPOR domain-containing protein [Paraglaciecola sp.]|uniref:SPOR domain-containing protein n=1 Tax=Paraglaciecola sp. TaxID=1920173 RepID=UPI00273F04A5|nr:SPOR domain-containing protein [Paraglaciecola sp.]MDP5030244.1 SPOR domain-containing protein [Paraglaciecola sp.]